MFAKDYIRLCLAFIFFTDDTKLPDMTVITHAHRRHLAVLEQRCIAKNKTINSSVDGNR